MQDPCTPVDGPLGKWFRKLPQSRLLTEFTMLPGALTKLDRARQHLMPHIIVAVRYPNITCLQVWGTAHRMAHRCLSMATLDAGCSSTIRCQPDSGCRHACGVL